MHIKNKKSKICVGVLSVFLMALSILGICKLVSLVSATSAGNVGFVKARMQNTEVNYGANWTTNQYMVVYDYDHNSVITNHAMCVMPSRANVVGGAGEILEHNPNTSSYPVIKEIVQILLATDANYGATAYSALYQTILSMASSIRINSSPSNADTLFAIGHMAASAAFGVDPEDSNYGLDVNERAVVGNIRNTITSWFTSNSNTEWQNYYLMDLEPTNSNYQELIWLESGNSGGGGGEDPGPDDPDPPTPELGTIKVYKTDENGNGLTGAIFWVTTYDNLSSAYSVIDMTNVDEKSITVAPDDNWCIKEVQAPSGYQINPTYADWKCGYGLGAGGTLPFHIKNYPETPAVSGSLTIKKVDADTGTTTPSGSASLSGAVFQVDTCTSASNCSFFANMIIGSNGTATLTGLPEGNYKVYEQSAGNGYLLNTSDVRTFSITSSSYDIDMTASPFENTVIRGGVVITKQRKIYDSSLTLKTEGFAGVSFGVYNNNSENLVTTITTNLSGVASTSNNALPYGTYKVRELSGSNNVAFDRMNDQTINISTDGIIVNAGTFTDELLDSPTISTSAREASSSADNPVRELEITTNANVIDKVTYNTLTTGLDYKVCGEIYIVSSQTLITPQPSCVTWTQTAGKTEVEVPFNNIDTTGAVGDSVSIVQKLYVINGSENLLLAIHNADLSDPAETLTVGGVAILTSASSGRSGASKQVTPGIVTITDTITAIGLEKDKVYYLRASLVDASGNTIGLVNGDNDNGHRITKQYTMTAETGTTVYPTMNIQFNSSAYVGGSVTVYEELYDSGMNLLADHKVPADPNQTIGVATPTIATRAWRTGAVNESSDIYVDTSAGITDIVTMTNLTPGADYILKGELYQVNSNGTLGNKVATSDNVPFTVGSGTENATATVNFTLDTTSLAGKKLVVYEYLYYGSTKVAEHTVVNDTNQIVTVMAPTIATTAVDGSDQNGVIEAESGQTILDTIAYANLEPGKSYYLCGVLMDKNTGNVLKINGTEVSEKCETKVAANSGSGSFTMTFDLDVSGLPGASIVVFETLYLNSSKTNVIAEHRDINDGSQTVKVRSRIGTKAVDEFDGDQKVGVGNATVVDTVEYEGLGVGTYTMYGKLMDVGTSVVDTGIHAESTFTITSSDLVGGVASGEVEMKFEINTKEYAGHKLVVFEELYMLAEPDVLVAEHKDENDINQTVTVMEPTIQTSAVDAADGDRELSVNANVTIKDQVAYDGLVPGTVYTLKGVLMDKATGKVLVLGNSKEAEEVVLSFTPVSDSGVARMEFEIPTAALDDKEIVVFETLYLGEEVEEEVDKETGEVITEGVELTDEDIIAIHQDINDESQTVAVGKLPKVPETGSMNNEKDINIINSVVTVGLVLIGCVVIVWYFKSGRNKVEFIIRK